MRQKYQFQTFSQDFWLKIFFHIKKYIKAGFIK